jgi:broad specificity phosphatase PhoE
MLAEVDPQAVRLVCMRHPELEAPAQKLVLGQRAAELSRRGRASVLALMRQLAPLSIDAFWCPDVAQCRVPAQALAKDRGTTAREDARLRDQYMGTWEGESWDAVKARDPDLLTEFFTDYGRVAPPGGESLREALQRVIGWWAETKAAMGSKTVVLVANAPLLSAFAGTLLGMPFQRTLALPLPPSAFAILDVFSDGARLRTWHPGCMSDEQA